MQRQSEEEPRALWEEEKVEATKWKPCSNRRPPGYPRKGDGGGGAEMQRRMRDLKFGGIVFEG